MSQKIILAEGKEGQQQARLYADCLEKSTGHRPVIYGTNGYEHWMWDDTTSPPRPVQGFHTRDELELMQQRRSTRKPRTLEQVLASPRIATVNP